MAFGKHNEEYDWLNDPFDEKKLAKEREEARMSTGSKLGIGCGCVVALIGAIVLLAVVFFLATTGAGTLGL